MPYKPRPAYARKRKLRPTNPNGYNCPYGEADVLERDPPTDPIEAAFQAGMVAMAVNLLNRKEAVGHIRPGKDGRVEVHTVGEKGPPTIERFENPATGAYAALFFEEEEPEEQFQGSDALH